MGRHGGNEVFADAPGVPAAGLDDRRERLYEPASRRVLRDETRLLPDDGQEPPSNGISRVPLLREQSVRSPRVEPGRAASLTVPCRHRETEQACRRQNRDSHATDATWARHPFFTSFNGNATPCRPWRPPTKSGRPPRAGMRKSSVNCRYNRARDRTRCRSPDSLLEIFPHPGEESRGSTQPATPVVRVTLGPECYHRPA